MKRTAALYPLAFLGLVGLLLWHPWRSDAPEAPAPTVTLPPSADIASDPSTDDPEPEEAGPAYEFGFASKHGIGKYYMGREIAKVMGHQGISWLERSERESEESPTTAIDALNFAPGTVIADIGAGSGYYTFRLAPLVPEGEVIAVDIQPEMISHLENRALIEDAPNVRPHLGTKESIELPPHSIDAAIMVDAYHEFSHPAEMMDSIVKALRPGGRVFLLEYRAEDDSVRIEPLHKMSEAQARKEMEAAGLEFVTNHEFLPWQHFLVFAKPGR